MNNTKTIIYGPMPYRSDAHSLYEFDCGNDSINKNIEEDVGFEGIYPSGGKCISVFTHGVPGHGAQPIIACAVGELVTWDSVNHQRCAPRIEIKLAGVDSGFKGLGLAGAVTAHVMQTLFEQAHVPALEMRMLDVVSPRARGLWERSGFVISANGDTKSPDMSLNINREWVDWLSTRWQPRLRPDMQLSASPYTRLQIA